MGYPMTFDRVVARNQLKPGYLGRLAGVDDARDKIGGDLFRLMADSMDGGEYTQYIAEQAGVDPQTAIAVLRALYESDCWEV